MNETQRKIVVVSLFLLAALCGAFTVIVAVEADNELFDDFIWTTLLAPASLVAALYLRAGGKSK